MKFTFTILLASLVSLVASDSPSGFINSNTKLVRAETHVQLNWEINLPRKNIEELIEIDVEKNEITARHDLIAEVRVLGAALGASNSPMFARAEAKSEGSYQNIFEDFASGVGAGSSDSFRIETGKELDFKFMTWDNSSPTNSQSKWKLRNPIVQTGKEDDRLFILQDGDQTPNFNPAFDQQMVSAFLAPYMTGDGEVLQIGPNDLILFVELNKQIDNSADFQDFVVLISFSEDKG